MNPAAHQLLRALYLHALAPSTANQDAVRAAGAALDTETGRKLNAPRSPAPVDTVVAEVHADLLARSEVGSAKYGVTLDRRDLGHAQWLQHGYEEALDLACYLKRAMRDVTDDALATAPVEPPHDASPSLRPLTPEPAEAVLGRAGEALAWDGRQPPVHVPFKPGAPHPYGDDAYQMTTDGVARLFPSKEAAQRWLAAMGKPPA